LGPTFSGVHVFQVEQAAVVDLLSRTMESGGYKLRGEAEPGNPSPNEFYVSPRIGNWVTVLPSNDLDGREFSWAEIISKLDCPALWLYLYEGDLFMYRLYRSGQLLDRYHSSTTVLDSTSRANLRSFRPYLSPGMSLEDIDRALWPELGQEVSLVERFRMVSHYLGIDNSEVSFQAVHAQGLEATVLIPEQWMHVAFDYQEEEPAPPHAAQNQ
jgi:hypothetical protein